MSRWPDDPNDRSPRWFGLIAALIMVMVFAVVGVFMWTSYHHNMLVDEFTGDWVETGAGSVTPARLSITEETKTVQQSADESTSQSTGDLLVSGTIDGRAVHARIAPPDFPPWESTVRTTLAGTMWALRPGASSDELVAVSDAGRTITFSR